MSAPAPPEDQSRLLEDALIAVRQQTALMRKCLDQPGKLMDALKCWYVFNMMSHGSYGAVGLNSVRHLPGVSSSLPSGVVVLRCEAAGKL